MISRRNFFSITILMAVVLFLCMSLNSLKDYWNDYTVNMYTETAENYPSKVNIYIPNASRETETAGQTEQEGSMGTAYAARSRVVCIGGEDSASMLRTEEWIAYTKRSCERYLSLSRYQASEKGEELPEMLVIDSSCVNWESGNEIGFLEETVEQGIHLVFCGLPDPSVLRDQERVRKLLGIRKVAENKAEVKGLHLRDGFLLGGEVFYLPEETDREKESAAETVFPGGPDFPWLLAGSGTKVYMNGIPADSSVKAENYPMLIWRKSFETAYVFVISEGYMEGAEGLGILSAVSAEIYPYEIYPAVNAQNIILAGYPAFADENADRMEEIYSRSMRQVFQEIIWPAVTSILREYHYKATCMMTPQFDYTDDELPVGEQFEYFLKILHEEAAEVGLSGLCVSQTPVDRKLAEDNAFIEDVLGSYDIVSFYAGSMEDEAISDALDEDILADARTVVKEYGNNAGEDIIGFLSKDVTAQSVLVNGFQYTYRNDFLVRSLETALGYSSMSFDMRNVAFPEDSSSVWDKLANTIASNVEAYGKPFRKFDRPTSAECDARIRNLLALDYADSRTGDKIVLEVSGISEEAWFVLRTHNESIKDMEGGSWKRLEKDAYLLAVREGEVIITLEPADERVYQ